MDTHSYKIEVTDTFGGESNYCWVRRYRVKANSIRGAANALARLEGCGWRIAYGDSNHARYNLRGAAICAFIDFDEDGSEGE